MAVLNAAVNKATETKAPQCIAIVDGAGHLLSFVRMNGAKVLSTDSAIGKAITAASSGKPTGTGNPETEIKMAIVTAGKQTNIRGGLPLLVDGKIVGGIGVGSGTLDQDVECAEAGAAVLRS
jgi:uncharacterized protein GlcG (DUF336 family)